MADEIFDRLIRGVESLADLRIATIVGDVEITIDSNGKATLSHEQTESPAKYPGALTSINLVDGDINNSITERLYDNETFMTFHNEQVEAGRKIVETNVKTITELARSAGESLKNLLSRDSSRS